MGDLDEEPEDPILRYTLRLVARNSLGQMGKDIKPHHKEDTESLSVEPLCRYKLGMMMKTRQNSEQVRWIKNSSQDKREFISYQDQNIRGQIRRRSNYHHRFLTIDYNTYSLHTRIPIATLLLIKLLLLLSSLLVLQSQAYQLTNNLIANNLPPKFITTNPLTGQAQQSSNSEIVVRVKEGPASIGKLIYTLKGEDPDEDPLTFGVLGSLASDLLGIENVPGNQANVYLRKELDRETKESYQITITLTDGKLGRGNWVR